MMDAGRTRGHLRIDKYAADGAFIETVEAHNIFLTSGINQIWSLVIGTSGNTFTSATATIGMGDSSIPASPEQTDLQATTNTAYVGMTPGFPTAPAAGKVQFQAIFGPQIGNFAWNEFVVRQANSMVCIDRGVQVNGTKIAGQVWTATITLSLS